VITWLIVIAALSVFQFMGIVYDWPENFSYCSTVLVFLSALGLIYRSYKEQKQKKKA